MGVREVMGFERWVDYALTCRCISSSAARSISFAGTRSADFFLRSSPCNHPAFPGQRSDALIVPTSFDDFPEVPVERYLGWEMRGADACRGDGCRSCRRLLGRAALDDVSLDAAWDISKAGMPMSVRHCGRPSTARLQGKNQGSLSVFEIAKECRCWSRSGLRRRGRLDYAGRDETRISSRCKRISIPGAPPPSDAGAVFTAPGGSWNRPTGIRLQINLDYQSLHL